jgi:hypothetical protein
VEPHETTHATDRVVPYVATGVSAATDPFDPGTDAGGSALARKGVRARLGDLITDWTETSSRWRHLALGLAAAVALLSALGLLYDATGSPRAFQVSGEITEGFNIPVLFSWAVLFGAGIASGVRSRLAVTLAERAAWIGVAVLFTFMAFDELLTIHETLEDSAGVDWQLLYLPVIAAGGLAWLALLTRMPRWSLEQVMWLTAAGLWFVSEILEKLEYDADDNTVRGFTAMNDTEKVLQFTGSCLFLLVALLAIERVRSGRAAAPRR